MENAHSSTYLPHVDGLRAVAVLSDQLSELGIYVCVHQDVRIKLSKRLHMTLKFLHIGVMAMLCPSGKLDLCVIHVNGEPAIMIIMRYDEYHKS